MVQASSQGADRTRQALPTPMFKAGVTRDHAIGSKTAVVRRKSASRPVSRVLYGRVILADRATRWPFIFGGHCWTPDATHPDD